MRPSKQGEAITRLDVAQLLRILRRVSEGLKRPEGAQGDQKRRHLDSIHLHKVLRRVASDPKRSEVDRAAITKHLKAAITLLLNGEPLLLHQEQMESHLNILITLLVNGERKEPDSREEPEKRNTKGA